MKEEGRKILGVIGGMGPLATQLFYGRIIENTEAHKDQEHLNMIILNHASMPDRTEAILKGNTDQLYSKLLEDARLLESMGADQIAVPCNTSHYFLDRIQEEIATPIIHMIRETVTSLGEDKKKVGILATDGTIRTGLYQQEIHKKGMEPVIPSEEIQRKVMALIYDGVKDGGPLSPGDFNVVEREMQHLGCDRVILACTELSVLKERFGLGDFYLDAMSVLVERSIIRCGHTLKQEGKTK